MFRNIYELFFLLTNREIILHVVTHFYRLNHILEKINTYKTQIVDYFFLLRASFV